MSWTLHTPQRGREGEESATIMFCQALDEGEEED